ncbi:MAG: TolC family protein [Muribaculaceae bacterium]|nr:TolC family protein [Muribaculaceae bacterium]
MKHLKTVIIALALVPLLGACSAVRKCAPPELNLPAAVVPGAGDSLTVADMEWWKFYGDSTLCGIIDRTLEHNRNIKAAASHIEQLRELYRISKAALLPSVNIGATADHETNDYAGESSKKDSEFGLKANLSWEIDLWGNLRWAKRKGEAEWLVSVEDERAMRMTLIAEAASAYFRLIALDNELSIVQRTLETRREGVAKAKLRFEGGLTSELVYQQAQVEYATAAALIPDLRTRIRTTENALSLLMGTYPGEEIPRGGTNLASPLPDSLPVGLPSQLLERRPDIRAAEQQLRAAMSAVGVAYTDRFPRLTFNLQGGWENDALKGFFSSPFSYVAGQLVAPVFTFGRKKARYRAALAAYDESRLKYEQKVLEAFSEVDDAVTAYRNVRETAALKKISCNAAREYVRLAELQYRGGSINYIEVLDAQRRYFDAQIGLSNAVRDENLALVQLYKALGGGWQSSIDRY